MKRPNLSKTWLLLLLAVAVEEATAYVFTDGARNSIVMAIPFLAGLWFAFPALWADQYRELGVLSGDLIAVPLEGCAAIWAISYSLRHWLRGEEIKSQMWVLVYLTIYFTFYTSAEIVLERPFPKLGRIPSLCVLSISIAWVAIPILFSPAHLLVKSPCLLITAVVWWLAFSSRLRKARRADGPSTI